MNKRCCKSCGKFIINDLIDGKCPACSGRRVVTSAKSDADQLNQLSASVRASERMLSDRVREIEHRATELKRVGKMNSQILEKIKQERTRQDHETARITAEKRKIAAKTREFDTSLRERALREKELAKLSREMASKEKKLVGAAKKLENRDKSLAKREKRVAKIPKSRTEFAVAMKKSDQQLQRVRNKVARLSGELEHLHRYGDIADWAGLGLGTETLWPNVELVVSTGSGPYDQNEFAAYLDGQQFELVPTGSARAAIMIIGREEWSDDDLEAQIEAREGLELRVYSQEMFLLAMATERDPLVECDFEQLINLFAHDHSALQYLIKNGFEWPNTGADVLADSPARDGWGVKESPLHLMGYHVGRSSDLTVRERHQILKSAYKGPLIPVPNQLYMREWGRPNTARRLWRMAHHVAHLANSQGRGKKVAGTHWSQDLKWMKRELFKPWMKFKWPETTVPGA